MAISNMIYQKGQASGRRGCHPATFLPVLVAVLLLFGVSSAVHAQRTTQDKRHHGAGGDKVPYIWLPLVNRLIADGEDPVFVRRLYASPSVRFNPRVMPRKVTHNEYKLDYGRFLRPERLNRARKYLRENRQLFDRIQEEFGVPGELEVAILLVETDLGNYLGAGPAVNILSSMALGSEWEDVKRWLPPRYIKGERAAQARKTLEKKSNWAYRELKALFKYCRMNRMDIYTLKGSIFGAIGLCQFMPSNALKFGVDFDRDGRIDLFQKTDACGSMANYLRYYGWRPGLSRKAQEKVVFHYNHSRPYVKAILDVAGSLNPD